MEQIAELSPCKCILLAITLTSESILNDLQQLILARSDIFDLELSLRILLTNLSEALEPPFYVPLLKAISTTDSPTYQNADDTDIDISSVKGLSETDASNQLRLSVFLPLRHESVPASEDVDSLSQFLVHRVHRIDAETGLLASAPALIVPFLAQSAYLRTWYASTIVPLIRMENEYYDSPNLVRTLDEFEQLEGRSGIDELLSKTKVALNEEEIGSEQAGRDFRGIVGPWVCGSNQRKRRKLNGVSSSQDAGRSTDTKTQDWRHTFDWIAEEAQSNFASALKIFDGWDGPGDVDCAEVPPGEDHLGVDVEDLDGLLRAYCQTAMTAIFTTETCTKKSLEDAKSLLARISRLLDYDPPPALGPDLHTQTIATSALVAAPELMPQMLQTDQLYSTNSSITKPTVENVAILHVLIVSATLLQDHFHDMSVLKAARIYFLGDETEQLDLVQKMLKDASDGPQMSESAWLLLRRKLLWLKDWTSGQAFDLSAEKRGLLGRVKVSDLAIELLKAYLAAGQFKLVSNSHSAAEDGSPRLSNEQVGSIMASSILRYYDNASNGNRTRGAMKKASDCLKAVPFPIAEFPDLQRCAALLAATHAMSFYSLTLTPGVPLQPHEIRQQAEPINLIPRLLSQNPHSYTKLDDLISIGQNLVAASPIETQTTRPAHRHLADASTTSQFLAARQVIGMAIEAALAENDFETAYSYVVNRLSTSPSSSSTISDDISWRAAFQAGRHRASSPSASSNSAAGLRRLEQRMDLLSHALQLAPASALPEILAAWRRCEEELLTLTAEEVEAERDFNDAADKGNVTMTNTTMPGSFAGLGGGQTFDVQQPRRKEMGRGGATEEAPMGLFDVARGAAAAFGRSTNALRGGGASKVGVVVTAEGTGGRRGHGDDEVGGEVGWEQRPGGRAGAGAEAERVRKRDMVASAVTGGLASGIGWVLGARPVEQQHGGQ